MSEYERILEKYGDYELKYKSHNENNILFEGVSGSVVIKAITGGKLSTIEELEDDQFTIGEIAPHTVVVLHDKKIIDIYIQETRQEWI